MRSFLGFFFFLVGAAFRLAPPRVGRAILSSSAWSLAANAASASTVAFSFFFGGGVSTTSETSSLSASRLVGELSEEWWTPFV